MIVDVPDPEFMQTFGLREDINKAREEAEADVASAKVYFPKFFNFSANKNNIIGQPTKKPIEYIKPSKPEKNTRPEIPRKDAADI